MSCCLGSRLSGRRQSTKRVTCLADVFMRPQLPREFLLGKKCFLTRLIDFTASVINYRDESFRAAQKRVRARVRDHQRKRKIAKPEEVYPAEFFAWALDFKKYDALRKLKSTR